MDSACKYAIEGQSIYLNPDIKWGKLQLLVVGQFQKTDHESPMQVRAFLKDYDVKLYESAELPTLINEIRQTGKDIREH